MEIQQADPIAETESQSCPTKWCGIVVLSAQEDAVAEHVCSGVSEDEFLRRLHYDDLGKTWEFSFICGELLFYTLTEIIHPSALYHRYPGVISTHPHYHKHQSLLEATELWKGNAIGQTRAHFHNFSKAYQGKEIIQKAALNLGFHKIRYPNSYFYKGPLKGLEKRIRSEVVVKSCSNVRSQVAVKEQFSQWEQGEEIYLPTFFQEVVYGQDIRVHLCDQVFWALKVLGKDSIDYRYSSKKKVFYEEFNLSDELRAFCIQIAKEEDNRCIGIDFIKKNDEYFCLESNPGPGWSTFQHSSKWNFANSFLQSLQTR